MCYPYGQSLPYFVYGFSYPLHHLPLLDFRKTEEKYAQLERIIAQRKHNWIYSEWAMANCVFHLVNCLELFVNQLQEPHLKVHFWQITLPKLAMS